MRMENSHQTAVLDHLDVLPTEDDLWNDVPWVVGRNCENTNLCYHLEVNAHRSDVAAAAALRNLRQEWMEPHRWDYCLGLMFC